MRIQLMKNKKLHHKNLLKFLLNLVKKVIGKCKLIKKNLIN